MFKKLLCAVLLIAISFSFYGCSKNKSVDVAEYEEKISNSETVFGMPTKEELEKCSDVKCRTVSKDDSSPISFVETCATYDEKDYEEKKEYYKEESLYFPEGFEEDIFAQTRVEYKGFVFRILVHENFNYPKDFVIVGQSDESRRFVFVKVESPDLDHIDNLKDFLCNEAEIDKLI